MCAHQIMVLLVSSINCGMPEWHIYVFAFYSKNLEFVTSLAPDAIK